MKVQITKDIEVEFTIDDILETLCGSHYLYEILEKWPSDTEFDKEAQEVFERRKKEKEDE